jgi:hypothetical protein
MAKRDRELIWPFQNSEDILWSPGLRKYLVKRSKGICVPFFRARRKMKERLLSAIVSRTTAGRQRPCSRRNEITQCTMSSFSPLSSTTLHARHFNISSHEYCASSAAIGDSAPNALFCLISCIKYRLLFYHFIHRTIFQINGNETTLVLRAIRNKIAIF